MSFYYFRLTAFILLSWAFYPALQAQTLSAGHYLQTSEMHHLMQQYEADYRSLSRFYFIKHSPERRERLRQLAGDYLEKLEKEQFGRFSINGKVDFVLFRRDLEEQLHILGLEEEKFRETKQWFGFAAAVYDLEKQRRRGASLEGQETGALLSGLAKDVRAASASLGKADAIDSRVAAFATETIEGLREALKSVYDFYNGYDPAFTWWAPAPYKELDTLLAGYDKLFKSKSKVISSQKEDGSGIRGNPIGREEIIRQLEYEMIPYSPEELVEIANKEFAWCDREMLKASAEMGFGQDWKKALEKVKNTYVAPGRQPELILQLYNASVSFLKEKDLVSIPPLPKNHGG
ncbi:DUF885 domain-containing protein [Anseongella ginsenosidimutans]|uniref:DUF885 domain-containing protein n=1 Tax=Anseongella ginsenosidimutans TaxID=496056 RepID=UPI001CEF9335|nr:DUF885 domain-containing protein [Anseongella ginsenosidimutans]